MALLSGSFKWDDLEVEDNDDAASVTGPEETEPRQRLDRWISAPQMEGPQVSMQRSDTPASASTASRPVQLPDRPLQDPSPTYTRIAAGRSAPRTLAAHCCGSPAADGAMSGSRWLELQLRTSGSPVLSQTDAVDAAPRSLSPQLDLSKLPGFSRRDVLPRSLTPSSRESRIPRRAASRERSEGRGSSPSTQPICRISPKAIQAALPHCSSPLEGRAEHDVPTPCRVGRDLHRRSRSCSPSQSEAQDVALGDQASRIPRKGGGIGPPLCIPGGSKLSSASSSSMTTPQPSRLREHSRSITPQRVVRPAVPCQQPLASTPLKVASSSPLEINDVTAELEQLRQQCQRQRFLLQEQNVAFLQEEHRRAAVEERCESLTEEVESARYLAASREKAELQSEVEALRSETRQAEMEAQALCQHVNPMRNRCRSDADPFLSSDFGTSSSSRAGVSEDGANGDFTTAPYDREAECSRLRSELHSEMAAVRRAYHRAEEQQWRDEATLEHAEQHAARCEAQVQELRSFIKARDESFEQQVAEVHAAATKREAAEIARIEANLHAEVNAEREALYAHVHEHLVNLTATRSSPSRGPMNIADQQVV